MDNLNWQENPRISPLPSEQCAIGEPAVDFKHSVASGDPTKSSFILWTRLTPIEAVSSEFVVHVEISRDRSFDEILYSAYTTTNEDIDYTVKIDAQSDEFSPGNRYYYRFSAAGVYSPIGSTKTLPTEDVEEISFAVYSCSNYAGGFYHAYRHPAVNDSVDFVIHLGDYLYEHENGVYTNGTSLNRTHLPNKFLHTLEDYRERYSLYRSDPDLQLSHQTFPWLVVWDDHEISDNSWLRGSVDTVGLEFERRRRDALRAYMEWLPIRPPTDMASRKIWRSMDFGKLAQLHLLDTRHYSRDVTDIYTNRDYIDSIKERPERTIMGFDQEEWLINSLVSKKQKSWQLVGSQLLIQPVNFTSLQGELGEPFNTFNLDGFDGYPGSRKRILSAVEDNQIDNVVFFAGDVHVSTVGKVGRVVEFGGSAVSSPTIYPQHYSISQCLAVSEKLVANNPDTMIWNEGFWRGYMLSKITAEKMTTTYYGFDVRDAHKKESYTLATFEVEKNSNEISRRKIAYGAMNN